MYVCGSIDNNDDGGGGDDIFFGQLRLVWFSLLHFGFVYMICHPSLSSSNNGVHASSTTT